MLRARWLPLLTSSLLLFGAHAQTTRPRGRPNHQSKQQKTVAATEQEVDLLLVGGLVVDGTGSDARPADVGIRGDRIVFVGDTANAAIKPARTINVTGLVVAPGFIDPHTHAGPILSDPARHGNVNYLMQGVTTVIVGNDGDGTPRVAEQLQKWQQQGVGTNVGVLVGHGAIRRQVLGNGDIQPTAEQLDQMKVLVRQGMQEGAFGLSTGLYYVPGSFAKTEEVIELAKVAAEMGGIYDTHMRDEDAYSIGLLGSIAETIRIGREAKIPAHISHIKALGPEVWGKSVDAIAMIRQARAEGVDVTADQYPYIASGSSLIASLLPPSAQAGTREEVLARLSDPATRAALLGEIQKNLQHRLGADSLLFTSQNAPELVGKTLAAVAKARQQPPNEVALDIIIDYLSQNKAGALSVASFNMSEDDLERFMMQDFVMTGSDGSRGHPRLYGTYPRKLRLYVYEKRFLTLPFAIRASSAFPAETLHIAERGVLRPGYFADVIAFDLDTVADRATYEKPEELAVGMKYVLVNGQLAVEDGKYTGALPGRSLRRQ